jgi:hypothetical protein
MKQSAEYNTTAVMEGDVVEPIVYCFGIVGENYFYSRIGNVLDFHCM